MNIDKDKNPENIEHFGITPIEAMLNGCFPIVYRVGGPSDMIAKLGVGVTFSTIDTLVEMLSKSSIQYNSERLDYEEISNSVKVFIEDNRIERCIEDIIGDEKEFC